MFDLKKFRNAFGLNQDDLKPILGVTQGFISRVERGKESFPLAYLDKLRNKYGDVVDEYITNETEPISILSKEQGQPILDIRVCAGHGIGLEGDENKVVEWVNIPKFDGCYGVTVYGDSMYDRFKSGDIIFVRPIQGRSDFDFGQCYVVITNEDRYIKNIYQSGRGDEYVTMTSYNTEINPDGRRKFPDRDILIDDIKHLYKVAGKLRRDQF